MCVSRMRCSVKRSGTVHRQAGTVPDSAFATVPVLHRSTSAYALTRFGGLKPAVARAASEGGPCCGAPGTRPGFVGETGQSRFGARTSGGVPLALRRIVL
jgi:hypothetical protein